MKTREKAPVYIEHTGKQTQLNKSKKLTFYRTLNPVEIPYTEKQAKRREFIKNKVLPEANRLFMAVFFTFIYGIGLAWFLEASYVRMYTGGVPGIGQLIVDFLHHVAKVNLNQENAKTVLSLFIIVANIPILLLGWFKVSKTFAFYSTVSIVLQATCVKFLQIDLLKTTSPLILAIAGGIFIGVGTGGTLKYGGSTGGLDIIGQVLALNKGKMSVGKISTIMNLTIISLGCFFAMFADPSNSVIKAFVENIGGPDGKILKGIGQLKDKPQMLYALYVFIFTSIRLLISMVVMDKIHNSYNLIEALIVTTKETELAQTLIKELKHGVTLVDAKGGYSFQDKSVLLTVVYQFEEQKLIDLIFKIDPKAFITFKHISSFKGRFRIKALA